MSAEAEASSVPSLRSQRRFTAWTPLRYVQALRYAPVVQQRHTAVGEVWYFIEAMSLGMKL